MRPPRCFVLLIVLLSLQFAGISICHAGVDRFEAFRDTLLNLRIDTSSAKLVEGLVFEDGLITIGLDSGVVVFLDRFDGRRVGALFIGTGSVSFTPNHPTEVTNLRRFYPNDVFAEDIDRACIAFADSRFIDQVNEYPDFTDRLSEKFSDVHKSFSSMVEENNRTDIDGPLSRALLNNYREKLFYLQGWYKKEMECILTRNPYDVEPYRLMARHEPKGISSLTFINQCPAPEGWPTMSDDGVEVSDQVETHKHTMVCNIDRSLEMQTTDLIDMKVRVDSVLWLEMELYPRLRVDTVRLGDAVLTTFRSKDQSRFWVRLPRAYLKGENLSLSVSYKGTIIERFDDYTILETSITWLPAHSYSQKSLYDITFSYPSSMKLLSLGKQESVSTSGRVTTSRWTTSEPNTNNSFHIGLFKQKKLETSNETPTADLYYNTVDQIDAVSTDLVQSLEFFTRLFGPLSIKHLNATELPGSHGEAFPGLLHLSSYAFFVSSNARTDDFFGEQFTSHEVAHQWWGIGVKPMIYRDGWISEGFAMYSCLLYSQLAARDGDKFFRLLKEYSDEITSFGKKAIGKDRKPPAIALGYRVTVGAGIGGGGAYNAFVYYKGAWVLHMLRNMMIDLRTMNEDAFMTVMKEFYIRHKGKRASTADFQKTIEDITGVEMQWFFNQWVYGNQIPTYRYAWKKERLPEGQWKVTLRIKQEDVADNFQMYVPIKIADANGKHSRMRLLVKGASSEVVLPHFSFEPDEVTFNDLQSVLCISKSEKF